jgi:hypothetical protein
MENSTKNIKKEIVFTLEETNVLVSLLNISLKTEGIAIMKNVNYFVDKFEAAFKEEEEKELEVKSKSNGVKAKEAVAL